MLRKILSKEAPLAYPLPKASCATSYEASCVTSCKAPCETPCKASCVTSCATSYLCLMTGANFFQKRIVGITLLLFLVSCATDQEKARDYNNKITIELETCGVAIFQLEEQLGQPQNLNEFYTKTESTLNSAKENLAEIGNFREDTLLVNPAIRTVEKFQEILSTYYKPLCNLHQLPQEQISFATTDSCRVLRMFIQNESVFTQQDFENAQQSFADKYKLDLNE